MAYFRVEPFGASQLNYQLGLNAAVIAAQYRKNVKISDYVVGYSKPPVQKQTAAQLEKGIKEAFKGKLITRDEWKKQKRKKKKRNKGKSNAT